MRPFASASVATPRLTVLAVIFFLVAGTIIVRLGDLALFEGKIFRGKAFAQRGTRTIIPAERGTIFAFDRKTRERVPIALTVTRYTVSANPKLIMDAKKTAEALASIFEKPDLTLPGKLTISNDPYVVLERDVVPQEAEKIRAMRLPGIGLERTLSRTYPQGALYAHLLGFFGYTQDTRVGRYGLEEAFEERLRGRDGFVVGERGAHGELIPASIQAEESPVPGQDIVLTIDPAIQFATCQALSAGFGRAKPRSGIAIVADPISGDILALCGVPEFDPNHYAEVTNLSTFKNTALSSYEPGSVFKVITMSGAIEAGAVGPDTTYVDSGRVKIGGFDITNAQQKTYGRQTMIQVLENSINTGAVFAMRQLGRERFREFVEKFGFGQRTDLGLLGESSGDISNLKRPGEVYAATASFGQGITVTPIQLVRALAALARGGELIPLRLVAAIEAEGKSVEPEVTKKTLKVLEPDTAAVIRAMLTAVVEHGHSKGARIPGYRIGGKTGTAQIALGGGRGYSEETNHTFVGIAPSDKPRFVVLVKFEAPREAPFAEHTATPVFREIAKFVLNYLEVPPER